MKRMEVFDEEKKVHNARREVEREKRIAEQEKREDMAIARELERKILSKKLEILNCEAREAAAKAELAELQLEQARNNNN